MVAMKRGIKNWELSGMGDGGRDEDQDCEEQYGEGHDKFGSTSGHDHTALSNRHAFLNSINPMSCTHGTCSRSMVF